MIAKVDQEDYWSRRGAAHASIQQVNLTCHIKHYVIVHATLPAGGLQQIKLVHHTEKPC